MATWIDDFPEYEPIKNGDPFLAEIVKADDVIDNAEDAQTIAWATRERLSFELATLYAWWSK